MILGVDTSTYLEELEAGNKFYFNGKEVDPLERFVSNGVDYMRIRLWHNPYSLDGKKYGAGTCDYDYFKRLAKLAMSKGMKILLDIHYSDFWVDPGKQVLPKAWQNHTYLQIIQDVYDYTKETLVKAKKDGIVISLIQIGNEITNGLLWPYGHLLDNPNGGVRLNYDKVCAFLKAGVKATREECPDCKIIIHLEKVYDTPRYMEYFNELKKYDVDYDIIGASYYPYWHGTFDDLYRTLNLCRDTFKKPIMVMELGYAFTLEDYKEGCKDHLVIREDTYAQFGFKKEFDFTPEGQAAFVRAFLKRAEEEKLDGIFFWEPLLIPGEGICWGTKAAQEYNVGGFVKEERSDWCNQCFADYKGNLLPAFDAYTLKK